MISNALKSFDLFSAIWAGLSVFIKPFFMYAVVPIVIGLVVRRLLGRRGARLVETVEAITDVSKIANR